MSVSHTVMYCSGKSPAANYCTTFWESFV